MRRSAVSRSSGWMNWSAGLGGESPKAVQQQGEISIDPFKGRSDELLETQEIERLGQIGLY